MTSTSRTATLRLLAVTLPLAGLITAPAAQAAGTTSTFQAVIGECAPGDELVIDATVRETSRTRADGVETLHLQSTGTVTRTGSGVVGSYSEKQVDRFYPDGSERYTGILSKLTVKGGGGYTWAGQADLPASGDPRITKGLAPLLEADFVAVVCDALEG